MKASIVWNALCTMAIILAIVVGSVLLMVLPVNGQERQFTEPVAEGEWVVPPHGVIVCNATVSPGTVDPDRCVWIEDHWGPYPTAEMCRDRMQQMVQEFPVIQMQQTGVPHWGGHLPNCIRQEAPGIDA